MFFDKFLKSSRKVESLGKKSSSAVKHDEIKKNMDMNLKDILKSVGYPDDLFVHRIEDGGQTAAVVI